MKIHLPMPHKIDYRRVFLALFSACAFFPTQAEVSDMKPRDNKDFSQMLLGGLAAITEASASEIDAALLEKELRISFLPPKNRPGNLDGPESTVYIATQSREEDELPIVRYIIQTRGVKIIDIDFSSSPSESVSKSLCLDPALITSQVTKLGWISSTSLYGHGHSSDTYRKDGKSLELVWSGSCLGFLRMVIQLPKDRSQ